MLRITVPDLPDALNEVDVDLFLAASGYEQRATHVATEMSDLRAHRKVALAFRDRRDVGWRKVNDVTFSELGFELVTANGSDHKVVTDLVRDLLGRKVAEVPRIVVDYSSMTKVWYSALVAFLWNQRPANAVVNFLYSPAEFSSSSVARPNKYVESLFGFSSLSSPGRPTALVVGLGYESERALGLVNYVEPAHTVAFLADPALDPAFVAASERANSQLINLLGEDNLVRYPLGDFHATSALLESCCRGLQRDYRVVLAPLGPKPFTLLCLLAACELSGVEVWRVSAGEKGSPKERKPVGSVLGLELAFTKDSLRIG